MGLLDDAIREHLELRRRRGADPDELARAEQEALGPVRRPAFEPDDNDFGRPLESDEGSLVYDRGGESRGPQSHGGRGENQARAGLSEAEYEEYYDEEYYDEEEGDEWAFQDEGSEANEYPSPRAERAPSSARQAGGESRERGDVPTVSRRPNVPPESAPPTQATRPEAMEGVPGEETIEYSVEDAVRADHRPAREEGRAGSARSEQGAQEDVLEETPEFLQDAPEHDRLWFEQRPPRDFDFDG